MKFVKNLIKYTTPLFTVLILDISIPLYLDGTSIHPSQVIKLFIMSLALGMLTALRKELDNKKWMLRLSYSVKRIIFFPLYFIITIITLLNLGDPFDFSYLGICIVTVIFIIMFIILCFFTYSLEKKKRQDYTQALGKYKEKLEDEKI